MKNLAQKVFTNKRKYMNLCDEMREMFDPYQDDYEQKKEEKWDKESVVLLYKFHDNLPSH